MRSFGIGLPKAPPRPLGVWRLLAAKLPDKATDLLLLVVAILRFLGADVRVMEVEHEIRRDSER